MMGWTETKGHRHSSRAPFVLQAARCYPVQTDPGKERVWRRGDLCQVSPTGLSGTVQTDVADRSLSTSTRPMERM